MNSLALAKRSLRRCKRNARRRLPRDVQARHAVLVANVIAPRLFADDVVAVYLSRARDGEVDLAPLIENCWARGIGVAVPVIDGNRIRFAAYRPDEPMRRNPFGIEEPERPAWSAPTVVLTPLVAFDDGGRRLGMGGGYYDRYLAAHPNVRRVGIAHECQRAPLVPSTATDMPLPAVVTESGWHTFAGVADTP